MLPERFLEHQKGRAMRRKAVDRWFARLGFVLTLGTLGVLAILLLNLAAHGLSRIDWHFLTSFPSRRAAEITDCP